MDAADATGHIGTQADEPAPASEPDDDREPPLTDGQRAANLAENAWDTWQRYVRGVSPAESAQATAPISIAFSLSVLARRAEEADHATD
jgi:hypothetical protein